MMNAKHRLSEPRPPRPSLPGKYARPERNRISGALLRACGIAFGALIVAAALAAFVVDAVGSGHIPPDAADHHVSQEGTLIAVSAGSVTARSRDGITRTYLVTPQTAVITRAGSQFAVNDEVDIIGTIQNGTALATAVAHRDLGHGGGPPMDYVAGQPVSGALDSN